MVSELPRWRWAAYVINITKCYVHYKILVIGRLHKLLKLQKGPKRTEKNRKEPKGLKWPKFLKFLFDYRNHWKSPKILNFKSVEQPERSESNPSDQIGHFRTLVHNQWKRVAFSEVREGGWTSNHFSSVLVKIGVTSFKEEGVDRR